MISHNSELCLAILSLSLAIFSLYTSNRVYISQFSAYILQNWVYISLNLHLHLAILSLLCNYEKQNCEKKVRMVRYKVTTHKNTFLFFFYSWPNQASMLFSRFWIFRDLMKTWNILTTLSKRTKMEAMQNASVSVWQTLSFKTQDSTANLMRVC